MKKISDNVSFLVHLAKAQAVLQSRFNSGCLGSLTFTEFIALIHLNKAKKQGLTKIALAKKIGLSASGVTRLLAPMEKIHVVETDTEQRDARVRVVRITRAGQERLALALEGLDAVAAAIVPEPNTGTIEEYTEFLLLLAAKADME